MKTIAAEQGAAAAQQLDAQTVSARIERLPLTPFHMRALSLMGAAHFFDAFDALAIAFVLPILIARWDMDPAQAGLLVSIGYLGQTLGAVAIGWASERWGRLRMVILSCWVMSLFSLASTLAWSAVSFSVLRFMQGIGLGGEVPCAATYINEFSSARLRGRMVFFIQTIFAAAVACTALLAVWMIPHWGWQSMYLAGGIPLLLAIVLRRCLPESARWLASRGRQEEADAVLTRIERDYESKRGKPLVGTPLPPIPPEQGDNQKLGLAALLAPRFLSRTLSVWLMAFCTSTTGYGLLVWMPTVYRTVFGLPMEQALRYSALNNFVSLLATIIGLLLVDRIGRRKLFTIAFLGGCLPLVALWGMSATATAGDVVKLSVVSMLSISILLPGIYVYAPEIYPTCMRGIGVGFASAWLRIASIVGPAIIGTLLKDFGLGLVFLFLGVSSLVGAVVTFFFGIETRGRALEEIGD